MADDRPNSVLTDKQREFLQKTDEEQSEDYTRQGRSYHRKEIQKRARQAFYDFALLYDELDEHERNRVFDPPEDKVPDLTHAIWNTIAFLYHGIEGDKGSEPRITHNRTYTGDFENALKTGVRRGESNRYPDDVDAMVTVEFDVNVTELGNAVTDWDWVIEALANRKMNELDDETLRTAVALATNPTDRLRELADLLEEERGGERYELVHESSFEPDEMADAARSLRELIEADDVDESDE